MDALDEIERWLRATGMAESRLGMLSAANQLAVPRLRNGTAQVSTLTAVLKFVREHPPANKQKTSGKK
jgi:hypothetical protein